MASIAGCVGLRKAAAVAPEAKIKKNWDYFQLPSEGEAAALNPGELKDCIPAGWADEGRKVLAGRNGHSLYERIEIRDKFPENMEKFDFSKALNRYLAHDPTLDEIEIFQGKDWGSYRGTKCAWDQAYMCFIIHDSETALDFEDIIDLHITPALRNFASMFNTGELRAVGECGELPPTYAARGAISKSGTVPLRMVMQYDLDHQGYKVILDTYVLPSDLA